MSIRDNLTLISANRELTKLSKLAIRVSKVFHAINAHSFLGIWTLDTTQGKESRFKTAGTVVWRWVLFSALSYYWLKLYRFSVPPKKFLSDSPHPIATETKPARRDIGDDDD